jgi:CheY-like chemotaxis protein
MWQRVKTFISPKSSQKNIRILVIEDNEVDQKIACAAVERGGYSAFKASDGKSGVEMAQTLLPDLIILDYNLPDSKGPQICQALKVNEATSRIPVLFLTSMDSPGSIIDCYEQGGSNYLAKPVNPKFLLKQIDQALKDQKTKE